MSHDVYPLPSVNQYIGNEGRHPDSGTGRDVLTAADDASSKALFLLCHLPLFQPTCDAWGSSEGSTLASDVDT